MRKRKRLNKKQRQQAAAALCERYNATPLRSAKAIRKEKLAAKRAGTAATRKLLLKPVFVF